jgi:Tir chaperone protein (CesT) family
MADKAHVHALMAEIGPAMGLAEVAEFERDNLWTLVVNEGTVLFADYDPEDARLWLSADVCVPWPGDRSRLYELLLQYNAQWRQTGGTRLALDGPEGSVILAYDLPVAGLDLHGLRTIVSNFRDTLDGWRKIVAAAPAASRGSETASGPDPMFQSGMIRG